MKEYFVPVQYFLLLMQFARHHLQLNLILEESQE